MRMLNVYELKRIMGFPTDKTNKSTTKQINKMETTEAVKSAKEWAEKVEKMNYKSAIGIATDGNEDISLFIEANVREIILMLLNIADEDDNIAYAIIETAKRLINKEEL